MKTPIPKSGRSKALGVEAMYRTESVPQYQGNPLIECLPPVLTAERWKHLLERLPKFDDRQRELPPEERAHCVLSILKTFVVQSRHIELCERLDLVLRSAYVGGSLISADRRRQEQLFYQSLQQGHLPPPKDDSESMGEFFSLIGTSGMGKTSSIGRFMSYFPDVILHSGYREIQIPVVYVECPHDGSTLAFARSLVRAIDDKMGTNYRYEYRKLTEGELIPAVAALFNKYLVGLLIIDEIEFLSHRKSGGQEEFIDFFLSLFNQLRMSIVIIGTAKAHAVVKNTFRQARRVSSLGTLYWTPFKKDDKDWDRLITSFWEYQWLRNPGPLTTDIRDAFHHETQGDTSLFVHLFILVQLRAIRRGDNVRITPTLIHTVAKDNFRLLRPMINALRSGNPALIARYDDFKIPDMQDSPEHSGYVERTCLLASESPEGVSAQKQEVRLGAASCLVELGIPTQIAMLHIEAILLEDSGATAREVVAMALARIDGKAYKEAPPASGSHAVGTLRVPTGYEALKQAGWIASPNVGEQRE